MALDKTVLDAYIQGLYDDDGNLSSEDYQLILNFIIANGQPELDTRDLIQIRRGNGIDLPSLTQGELAFTLDNEDLYVGGLAGNKKLTGIFDVDGKSNIVVVAGAIRQDATDRTKWNYINDSNHDPLNVLGDYAFATASQIQIDYAETYSKVLSFVCSPDETFANAYQMKVGGSVGLANTLIKASASFNCEGRISYDGSGWQSLQVTGTEAFDSIVFSGGNLTITHKSIQGVNVMATPYSIGANPGPYTPCLKASSPTSMIFNFYDEDGLLVTTPDTRMSLFVTRSFNDGISLDGTNGYDDYAFENGNIWFMGIFEK